MERSMFNVPDIFSLKPLFFEKNEIKWNQRNRKVYLFGTTPLIDYGSFFLNLIFLEK